MQRRRQVVFQVGRKLCGQTIKKNVRDNDVSVQCQNIWSIPLFFKKPTSIDVVNFFSQSRCLAARRQNTQMIKWRFDRVDWISQMLQHCIDAVRTFPWLEWGPAAKETDGLGSEGSFRAEDLDWMQLGSRCTRCAVEENAGWGEERITVRGKAADRKEELRRAQVHVRWLKPGPECWESDKKNRIWKTLQEENRKLWWARQGSKMHITPRLETARPGKAAAGSLPTGVNQQGTPPSTSRKPPLRGRCCQVCRCREHKSFNCWVPRQFVSSVLGSHYQVDTASEEGAF